MRFERPPPRTSSPRSIEILEQVNFLRAAGFGEEEDALVGTVVAQPPGSPHEWLDVAEGLTQLGRTADAVRLGWRAASALTLNDPRVIRVIFPWPLRDAIEAEAREFGVDPYLLAGLIRQESAFRVKVVSRAGAQGLMQLMPPTAQDVARRLGVEWDRSLLHVADANLHLGASHFAGLLKRYDGAVIPALAAYNAGGTAVRRWLRFPEARDRALFVERVPYRETRGYLRTVLRNRALYRALYPHSEEADTPR
jgi:soluble lytic murein transglycosylase